MRQPGIVTDAEFGKVPISSATPRFAWAAAHPADALAILDSRISSLYNTPLSLADMPGRW
jgi:hypothetical protein